MKKVLKLHPEITQLQEEFLIGCVLGDGTIQKQPTSKYPEFTCNHGPKQYSYILWKYNIMSWPNTYLKQFKRKTPSKKTGKFYEYSYLRTAVNNNLFPLYNMFYKDKKKIITDEIMEKYTKFSLAVHYMDDGSKDKDTYWFATCGFDYNSVEIFRKYLLSKFNIETTHQKDNRIRVRNKSVPIMTSLIKNIVEQIPYMTYKLISSHNPVNCLETPEEDNQQPSSCSDTEKGSTTSSESHRDNNSTTKAGHFWISYEEWKFLKNWYKNHILNHPFRIFKNEDIV